MKKRINKITLQAVLLSLLVVSIVCLVVYNVRDVLFGAPLSVTMAYDGATLEDTYLPVSGVAGHAHELLINGRPIVLDKNGRFSDSILLSPGYNIVEVAQKDRFGNEKVKRYHLVVAPPATVAKTSDQTYQQ